jgi:hypothetical protein
VLVVYPEPRRGRLFGLAVGAFAFAALVVALMTTFMVMQ